MIELAKTEWAAQIVFVRKKDGSLRFRVDYGKMNAVLVGGLYLLPRMDGCTDSIGDAAVFPSLVANSGF